MSKRDKQKVAARTNWRAIVDRLSSGSLSFAQDENRRRRADRTTYVSRLNDGEVTETVELAVMHDSLENGVVTITDEEFGDYMITFDITAKGIRMSINSSVHFPPPSIIPEEGAVVFEQLALAAAEAAGRPFEFSGSAVTVCTSHVEAKTGHGRKPSH
ncbi:hypothetical protein HFN89_02735 [Rhizobium laguerreae]|nr:hypothetical protein [Rhizobium laguerreae]